MEHEKTRGIVYTETELAGKPFIIAERPNSKNVSEGEGALPESPEPATPEQDKKTEVTNIYYEPDEKGNVQTAFELTNEGDGVDLSTLKGSNALLTTNDTTYYFSGEYVSDLMKMKHPRDGETDEWDVVDDLPTVRIGEPLVINGEVVGGPINKIEIEQEKKRQDELGDEWQARGANPFQQAEDLLDEADEAHRQKTQKLDGVGQGEEQGEEQNEGRWARFKRGVWKHLYESPIIAPEGYEPMTPMGPPIQPAIPFEQWYAEKHQEEESPRQRRILLAAVGALAAAGIIALGLASKTEEGTTGVPVHPHQNTPAKKGAAKLPGTPEAKTAVRMKPGDNPWTESEDILQARGNAHPTPAQIEELDKQMAELNPDKYSYSGTSSEHMPVGTELKVPKP
jgi:hypothetical protein